MQKAVSDGSIIVIVFPDGKMYTRTAQEQAVKTLFNSKMGQFFKSKVNQLSNAKLIGISVMWSGQVVPALLLSHIVKEKFVGARLVWGGAHVTAIIDEIIKDQRFGTWVDGFLPGHCEKSFVDLITSVFFIDDLQVVRPNEVGSFDYIKEHALKANCKFFEYELEIQFRCG